MMAEGFLPAMNPLPKRRISMLKTLAESRLMRAATKPGSGIFEQGELVTWEGGAA